LVEEIASRGELLDYHLAHSARGEFCRQLGRIDEAKAAYQKALSLTQQAPEKHFLERRLAELKSYKQ
jgi:RNA polymerase sigma-70 factor (ECF subfamily)